MSEYEKKLAGIFAAHAKQAEDKTRALQAIEKERKKRALELGQYARKVLEPTLSRLAGVVQKNGHKATLHATGAILEDGSPARAILRVVPAGSEHMSSDKYHPTLQFEMSAHHAAINVYEHAVFGGSGSSQSVGTFLPDELAPERIEALFVDLMERTFKSK